MNAQRIVKLFYFCLFFSFLKAKVNAQSDTSFIDSYYNAIVPRGVYTFKQQNIIIDSYVNTSNYNSEDFSTGDQHFLGADVGYKWMTLGYSFGINAQNTNRNLDLRFSTTYKPFNFQANYTQLDNLTYSYFDTTFSEKSTFKPINNTFVNIGFKVDYIFNYKKYCYSAGFSQGGKQLKSKGSVIGTLAYTESDFAIGDVPTYLNRDSTIFNVLKINAIKSHLMELGAGYAYNWVIQKHFLVAVSEVPCIGFQQLDVGRQGELSKTYNRVSFVNYFRLGLVWHVNRFFTGFSVYNTIRVSEVDKFDYTQNNVNVALYAGWVFTTKPHK